MKSDSPAPRSAAGGWIIGGQTDPEAIRAFLETDRLYAAYAIGDLEPELFADCLWLGAERNGSQRALALLYRGLVPPAFFLMGDPAGLAAILAHGRHPDSVCLTCRAEHLPAVAECYAWENEPRAMDRMVLRRRDSPPAGGCVRLTDADARPLGELLACEQVSGFSPAQIGRGVFFGIFRDGRLAAAAGTHLVSPRYGVAAMGNIVTHPDYRGRGFGTAAAGAVLGELVRAGIRDIVLNVRRDNPPALRVYEKLGFDRYCSYCEGPASLRGAADAGHSAPPTS
jgi:ribosomal protein S18 acetylase RimI-like enzyme